MEIHGRAGVALDWLESAGTVLDIGCSGGLFSTLAMGKGSRVIGMDVDLSSLKAAKLSAPMADFALGSGEALPYRDETYDAVVMLDVLEHVPSERKTLDEVDRVLRPDGKLIISVPNKGRFGFLDAQNSVLFAAGRKMMGRRGEAQFHRHYSLKELQDFIGPKYKLSKLRYGGYLLFPLCGYILMVTDPMRLVKLSQTIRRIEQVDFNKDQGTKSWHMMAEFVRVD
jgi:ubiquinone/menaquinone biosynthesis C-methylase UbiE